MSRKLRKTAITAILAIAAVLVAGGSGTAKPAQRTVGEVEVEFGGGFLPGALHEEEPTPIALSFWEKIRTLNELRPPPLREFRVEGDKHVEFDLEDRPVCPPPGRGARLSTAELRKKCGPAVIGTGQLTVGVAFAGDMTLDSESDLLVVNGGATSFYLYAFLPAPITSALVAPIRVKKVRKGRFGSEMIASIPKIADGGGSVTFFKLDFDRGVLRATCSDRRLRARLTVAFEDDTRTSAGITKACRQKAESGSGSMRGAS